MKPILLVCGVSGSGKSWACRQVAEKFHYIPHDRCWVHPDKKSWDPKQVWAADMGDDSHYLPGAKSNHVDILIAASAIAEKPVLSECPFAERKIKEDLERVGIKIVPIFVIEDPEVVSERYLKREGKPLPKNVYTRASSILQRAEEWNAFYGSSNDVLRYLSRMGINEVK